MTVVVFLPEGKTQAYDNASNLRVEKGLTRFNYLHNSEKKKQVMTTLPILVEEDAVAPKVSVL